jgi:thymidylate synthase (FAD)
MNDEFNLTKRLTVSTAENILDREYGIDAQKSMRFMASGEPTGEHNYARLIDYMGGDLMVERVATAGHGVEVFKEKPDLPVFLNYLTYKGIYTPFKWVQFKFHIHTSIANALQILYDPNCSVNEYSGRYSIMIDSSFIPAVEYLLNRPTTLTKGKALKNATLAHELFKDSRATNYAAYQRLLELNLSRELARIPLELANDTQFYWKMDLISLVNFISNKEKTFSKHHLLTPFLDIFKEAAIAVAPLATEALLKDKRKMKMERFDLTHPDDEYVIDNVPVKPKWEPGYTKRETVPGLEEILFVPQKYLDHGFVFPVDYMGQDSSPAESARVSYGKGTKKKSEDAILLRHLRRNLHTSPFEQNELAVEGKVPIFIDPRQLGRHRTLDKHCFMDEILVGSDYYTPADDELRVQSIKNRQGRGEVIDGEMLQEAKQLLTSRFEENLNDSRVLRRLGVPEELVRLKKGVGFYTYIERTGDSHNWFKFLRLRWEEKAQKEAQIYAGTIADFVQRQTPTAFQAFLDYEFNSQKINVPEMPLFLTLMSDKLKTIDPYAKDMHGALGFLTPSGNLTFEGVELAEKIKHFQDLLKTYGNKIDAVADAIKKK